MKPWHWVVIGNVVCLGVGFLLGCVVMLRQAWTNTKNSTSQSRKYYDT